MKVIGLVPARNEAWVLPYSLAALSGFCDVILPRPRGGRRYAGLLAVSGVVCSIPRRQRIREQRWQPLDAARSYDGRNSLWSNDGTN